MYNESLEQLGYNDFRLLKDTVTLIKYTNQAFRKVNREDKYTYCQDIKKYLSECVLLLQYSYRLKSGEIKAESIRKAYALLSTIGILADILYENKSIKENSAAHIIDISGSMCRQCVNWIKAIEKEYLGIEVSENEEKE